MSLTISNDAGGWLRRKLEKEMRVNLRLKVKTKAGEYEFDEDFHDIGYVLEEIEQIARNYSGLARIRRATSDGIRRSPWEIHEDLIIERTIKQRKKTK